MKPADVFVLKHEDGRPLPPAQQASTLAKYSRSPDSAREILAKTTPEDAERFQEKWDVTWGHSSVGELCSLPYCFENVSILASKKIEAYQRAAYSEKSTRYQAFSEESFVMPDGAPEEVKQAASLLYKTYLELEAPMIEYVRGKASGKPVSESVIKARAFDSLRYLLPAGTGTNLAAVVNARDGRYMMSDFLGSSMEEMQEIGKKMMCAASDVAPVFGMGVKPAQFEPEIVSLGSGADPGLYSLMKKHCVDSVVVLSSPIPSSWPTMLRNLVSDWYGLSMEQFEQLMRTRGKRQVPNVFKKFVVSLDTLMDYGAYRDMQRHRRCEQFAEPLSPKYGFSTPDDIWKSQFVGAYTEAMNENLEMCSSMLEKGVPLKYVQYALPLGTRFRCEFQMDLKELYYVAELRTQPQGHISYRRIAWQMLQAVAAEAPELMRWCEAVEPVDASWHK